MSRLAKASFLPLLVCAGAVALGLASGGTEETPGGGVSVSVARVLVSETTVPACGDTVRAGRDVVVVTAHMRGAAARSVAGARIDAGGGSWNVVRSGGTCTLSGPGEASEPCMVESCQADVCALRIPVPPAGDGPGAVTASYRSDAGTLGSGRAAYGPARPARGPALAVTRSGDALAILVDADSGTSGRATLVVRGRPVADAPLRPDAGGRAALTVPPGVDEVVVSVSGGADGVVEQSSARVPGPFDGTCGAGQGTSTTSPSSNP